MAFCNTCGSTLMPGAQFCNKCGATVAGTVNPPVASPPAPPPAGSSNTLKVVLIVVAVVIAVGIIGIISVAMIGYHFAKNARVHRDGDRVKVETPFGNVDTTGDPAQLAKDMGVDVYPGAEVQKEGSATTSFGNMRTASAVFTSSDPVDKICAFYRARVSNAMVATSDQNRCSFVSNDKENMLTINVESAGDRAKIAITSVSKKAN
jgi:hypothetical protein